MKNQIQQIELENGTKYPICFTLNVMEEIQEKYGNIENWIKKIDNKNKKDKKNEEPDIKSLKFGLQAMINEGIDIENENLETKREFLNLKQVGRLITEMGAQNIMANMGSVISASTKTNKPKNE